MSRVTLCVVVLITTAITATADADDDLATRLMTCHAVNDENDRLACYDELATSLESDVESETALPVLGDDVAKGTINGTKVENPEFATVVTRCELARREQRLYFFMENGQVWKQSNSGRTRIKEKDCRFEATIQKDRFGWKMSIPSMDRSVRVRRIR